MVNVKVAWEREGKGGKESGGRCLSDAADICSEEVIRFTSSNRAELEVNENRRRTAHRNRLEIREI